VKSIEENLTQYAAHHRDRRNIATHFAGIPMIVFAVIVALQAAWIPLGPVDVTFAAIVSLAICVYYLRLDWIFGVTLAIVLLAMCAAASEITARLATGSTLGLAAAICGAASRIASDPRSRAATAPRSAPTAPPLAEMRSRFGASRARP
jgi:uncharacterized membrane protein YGL010W